MATTQTNSAPSPGSALTPVRAWRSGVDGVSPVAIDAVVAVTIAAVASAALVLSDEPAARPVDALAYMLLLAASAPLVARRRWPATGLLTSAGVALLYFLLGYPGGPPTVVLLAAVYSAAIVGRRAWVLAVTTVFAGAGSAYRALVEDEALVGVLLNSALFVLVALLGELVYSRRALRAEVADRLRRAGEEREQQAQRRVVEERMQIARELHDVMAHTVAAMTVQAGVAADTISDRPQEARAALQTLRATAKEATSELQATIAVLRRSGDEPPLLPSPGLGDLGILVETARQADVEVEVRESVATRTLPAAVDVTAYRIIQEAITNVVRHAGATTATVALEYGPTGLLVTVDDDGRGTQGHRSPVGYGLIGIRERAEALGGSASFGIAPAGGFRVQVRLPLEGH